MSANAFLANVGNKPVPKPGTLRLAILTEVYQFRKDMRRAAESLASERIQDRRPFGIEYWLKGGNSTR